MFDRVSDRCKPANKSRLRLTRLEDRVTPTGLLDIVQIDAVGYISKTVAVRIDLQGTGTPAGSLNWGDGSTTVSLAGTSYGKDAIFTHVYSSTGTFTVSATDTNLSNSDSDTVTITKNVPPSMPVDQPLGLEFGQTVTPTGNNPKNISAGSVRYADGLVSLQVTDLTATGYAMPWGQSRSWTNGPGFDIGSNNGNGWVETQLPSLIEEEPDKLIALALDGTNARTFDEIGGGVFQERYFGGNALVHDGGNDELVLTTPDGVVYIFNDFTVSPAGSRGQFVSRTDPNGNITSVYSRNGDGWATEIRRGGGAESWLYEYIDGGANDGRLERVTLRRGVPLSYTALRKVEYSYFGTSEDFGNLGDLKTAIIKNPDGDPISTQYFRYYKPGEANGFTGGLKMMVGFASYERADVSLDPLTSSDEALDDFADFYFQYDPWRRVKLERVQGVGCSLCSAGVGEYTFSYFSSGNDPGTNSWATRTTETLPGGDKNVVYSNSLGQVMLQVAQDIESASVAMEWPTYHRYDDDSRLIFTANTSVFEEYEGDLYDEDADDLVASVADDSPFLQHDAGLVMTYQYGSSTTADDNTPGNVAGYLQEVSIQRGEAGDPVQQGTYKYFEITEGDLTVHPLAQQIAYRSVNSDIQTTSYAYEFATDSIQIVGLTVTYAAVTAKQNGPDSADNELYVYDDFGRLVWAKDGGGYITYREYDDATGTVTLQINDVELENDEDYDDALLPGTWETPADGGLHLISQWTVEFLGRVTSFTSPRAYLWVDEENQPIDYTVYDDVAHEVRFYPAWDNTLNGDDGGPTGPIRVYREDWAGKYTETLSMSAVPSVDGGLPTGGESISSLLSLSRTVLNNAGQAIEQHDYFRLDDVAYSSATLELLGAESAKRHYESITDYAARGGVKRTETPTGTITRYVRDARNRVTEIWIGTDDNPTSGSWSPTNIDGTNLFKVETFEYDLGGMGDGNLTLDTQYPGGLGVANRVTAYFYDWRNRPVVTKIGVQGDESLTLNTNRPLYYAVYDNLNQITSLTQYDGDNVTISFSNGVPNAPSSSLRRAKTATDFDERGREYRTTIYDVDPADGDISAHELKSDTWYNRHGNVIKMLQPGGLVTKYVHDGMGRLLTTFVTDGGGDDEWSEAGTVAGDKVFEESWFTYDSNTNVVQSTTKQRTPAADSTTGVLGDFETQPYARISHMGYYFDRADRLIASVDVGTNDDDPWTVPSEIPTRSDEELVIDYTYDAASMVFQVIDPRGVESRTYYDALQRVTQTIEGYVNGIVSAHDDRVVDFTYDGSHHVLSKTLWLDNDGIGDDVFERTEYDYGVAGGVNGNVIWSNDLLDQILYPDPETGSPTESQYLFAYNALSELIIQTDVNDTEHTYTFDVVGRPVADAVTDYTRISDSILRITTAYDSAGRAYLFTSWDDDVGGDEVNQVKREFNGFGQLAKEYQESVGVVDGSTPYFEYSYSPSGNKSLLESVIYPNGEEVEYTHDAIGRVGTITFDSNEVEALGYLGLATILNRDLGNGTLFQTISLDRFGRVGELLWEGDSENALVHHLYGYDRNSNLLWKTNELHHALDELYHDSGDTIDSDRRDGLNQLEAYLRGVLSDSNSDGVLDRIDEPDLIKEYSYDGVGNLGTIEDSEEGTLTRAHDLQNRLTTHDGNGLEYDDLGNLTRDDLANNYTYDAWNRLVGFNAEDDRYAYDATSRRIKEGTRSFLLDVNGTIAEEYEGGDLLYQNAWSITGGVNGRFTYDESSIAATTFAITDGAGSTLAIVVDDGIAVEIERYVYDPRGQTAYLDGTWEKYIDQETNFGWTLGWSKNRVDDGGGFLQFGDQAYSSRLARSLSIPAFNRKSAGGAKSQAAILGLESYLRANPSDGRPINVLALQLNQKPKGKTSPETICKMVIDFYIAQIEAEIEVLVKWGKKLQKQVEEAEAELDANPKPTDARKDQLNKTITWARVNITGTNIAIANLEQARQTFLRAKALCFLAGPAVDGVKRGIDGIVSPIRLPPAIQPGNTPDKTPPVQKR